MAIMSRRELAGLETFTGAASRLARRRADLQAAQARLAGLTRDAETARAELERRLGAAAEAAREGTSRSRGGVPLPPGGGRAPLSVGGRACPQADPRSFANTWGAPRSGGRRHQGTDFFGARGGNVYAITSGVVEFTKQGARSGLFLGLRGDDGNSYWYLHLQDFVPRPGQRVSAGQLIAHNGDSGNAHGKGTHIHFEIHPGGGRAINPYSLLRQLCG